MSVPRPGEYITAKCGRCSDVTGHVVMIVVDGVILKVECKACGSIHKYRDTKEKAVKKAQGTSVRHVRAGQARENAKEIGSARSRPSASRSTGAPRQSPQVKLEMAWQEAMLRHSGETPIAYNMNTSYAPQDFVEHSLFGKGEVINAIRPDKIDILFQEGMKTLRCKL